MSALTPKGSTIKRNSPSSWRSSTSPFLSQRDLKDYIDQRKTCSQGKKISKSGRFGSSSDTEDYIDESDEELNGYAREQSDSRESKSSSSNEVDNFFGEELCLSDLKSKPQVQTSTKQLLRKKKAELQERRVKLKQLESVTPSREAKFSLPPLVPLDKLEYKIEKYDMIKMPEQMPNLAEFIKLINEDVLYDPRYRNNAKQKGRKLAERYLQTQENSHLSRIPEESVSQRYNPNLTDSESSGGLGSSIAPELNKPELRRQRKKQSLEVLGVTDSEPCKTHYYAKKYRKDDICCKQAPEGNKDFVDKSTHQFPHRTRELVPKVIVKFSPVDATCKSTMFAKPLRSSEVTITDSDTESSSQASSESETDEEDCGTFGTNKLNFRYSFERLKKKRRGRAMKKKPAFVSILSKYYKMQNSQTLPDSSTAGRATPVSKKKRKEEHPILRSLNLFGKKKEGMY